MSDACTLAIVEQLKVNILQSKTTLSEILRVHINITFYFMLF